MEKNEKTKVLFFLQKKEALRDTAGNWSFKISL